MGCCFLGTGDYGVVVKVQMMMIRHGKLTQWEGTLVSCLVEEEQEEESLKNSPPPQEAKTKREMQTLVKQK